MGYLHASNHSRRVGGEGGGLLPGRGHAPCRSMNSVIEGLAKNYKVCKVNVDTNQPLAAAHSISSIPALLISRTVALWHVMWE